MADNEYPREVHIYDGNAPMGMRAVMETADGLQFTMEQWQLVQFMERLDAKLDALTAALTAVSQGNGD